MTSALLPANATLWEKAVADALPASSAADSGINAMRRFKYTAPRVSMLPYLVWEYGLGELTPYVPNLYNLIDQGVRWQRLRGTISAVAVGLAWVGYSAIVEEEWTGRRFWNSFQLRFPSLPANDSPDLARIEGITNLSVPKRSKLRRGVHRYDIPAFQGDHTRLDGSMLDVSSGVAITQTGTLWSFGRTTEFVHDLVQSEGEAIGNWIAPVEESGLAWPDVNIPWSDANFLWSDDPTMQRRAVMAAWFNSRTMHLRLRDEAGAIIGYRRCRAALPVVARVDGAFVVNEVPYEPWPNGTSLYVEARTDFEDADGIMCRDVAIVVGGVVSGVGPGKLWLEPSELMGGAVMALRTVNVPLRATVRDQFKFLVRF